MVCGVILSSVVGIIRHFVCLTPSGPPYRALKFGAGIAQLIPELRPAAHPIGWPKLFISKDGVYAEAMYGTLPVLTILWTQRVRFNGVSTKQKNHPMGGFYVWWRRRESNPRPQILRFRIYMFSSSINLTLRYPMNRENVKRSCKISVYQCQAHVKLVLWESTPDTKRISTALVRG